MVMGNTQIGLKLHLSEGNTMTFDFEIRRKG